jgi:hypothetical protein
LPINAQSVGLGSSAGTRGGDITVQAGKGATTADAGGLAFVDGANQFALRIGPASTGLSAVNGTSAVTVTSGETVVGASDGSGNVGQLLVVPSEIGIEVSDAAGNQSIVAALSSTVAEIVTQNTGTGFAASVTCSSDIVTITATNGPSVGLATWTLEPERELLSIPSFVTSNDAVSRTADTDPTSIIVDAIANTSSLNSTTVTMLLESYNLISLDHATGNVANIFAGTGASNPTINLQINENNVAASSLTLQNNGVSVASQPPSGSGYFHNSIALIGGASTNVPTSCLASRAQNATAATITTSGNSILLNIPLPLPASSVVSMVRLDIWGLIKIISAGTGTALGDAWSATGHCTWINNNHSMSALGGQNFILDSLTCSTSLNSCTLTTTSGSDSLNIVLTAIAPGGTTLGLASAEIMTDLRFN